MASSAGTAPRASSASKISARLIAYLTALIRNVVPTDARDSAAFVGPVRSATTPVSAYPPAYLSVRARTAATMDAAVSVASAHKDKRASIASASGNACPNALERTVAMMDAVGSVESVRATKPARMANAAEAAFQIALGRIAGATGAMAVVAIVGRARVASRAIARPASLIASTVHAAAMDAAEAADHARRVSSAPRDFVWTQPGVFRPATGVRVGITAAVEAAEAVLLRSCATKRLTPALLLQAVTRRPHHQRPMQVDHLTLITDHRAVHSARVMTSHSESVCPIRHRKQMPRDATKAVMKGFLLGGPFGRFSDSGHSDIAGVSTEPHSKFCKKTP